MLVQRLPVNRWLLIVGLSAVGWCLGCEKRDPKYLEGRSSPRSKAVHTNLAARPSNSNVMAPEPARSDASEALAAASNLLDIGTREALESAYRIQLKHLGQFDTNTFLTLSRLVARMVDDQDKDELARKRMYLELLTSSVTNIFHGEEARDWLVNLKVALVDVYSKQGLERDSEEVVLQLQKEVSTELQPFFARAANARREIEEDLARMQREQPDLLKAPAPSPAMLELKAQILGGFEEYDRERLRLALEDHHLPSGEIKAVLEYSDAKRAGQPAVNPAFDELISQASGAARHFNSRASEDRTRRVLGALAAKPSSNLLFLSNSLAGFTTNKRLSDAVADAWRAWNFDFNDGRDVGSPWARIRVRDFDEEDGIGMALAVLNLKGAQLDRESRLQRALALSEDADVLRWRDDFFRIQGELARQRNPLEKLMGGVFTNWTDDVSRQAAVLAFQQEARTYSALAKELESLRRRGTALPNAGAAEWVTINRVSSALPAKSVLVEFLKFPLDSGPTEALQDRYGAVVLSPHPGEPRAVRLGKSADVDQAVASLRELVNRDERNAPTGAETAAALQRISDLVWRPLEALLPEGVDTIYLNPDGDLHLVPFEFLPVRGSFLGENVFIRRISRAAVFGADPPNPNGTRRLALWFNPDYDANREMAGSGSAQGLANGAAVGTRSPGLEQGGNFLGQLGSASKEASEVARLARTMGGLQLEMYSGRDASEHRLATMRAPFALHIITHGLFAPGPPPVVKGSFGADMPTGNTLRDHQLVMLAAFGGQLPRDSKLPTYRAAVALAGANHAWRDWRRGITATSGTDGILTAFEAAQLDFNGTWLVALAACETGVGTVVDGEAVVGMQSVCLQAGALNVLYALWKLDDPYSPEFMKRFYSELFKAGDPGVAFALVQRSEFRRLYAGRQENLPLALRLSGPFALVSRAPQVRISFPRSE